MPHSPQLGRSLSARSPDNISSFSGSFGRASSSTTISGVSRAKLCVCGASSQLGRERSRLLRAEQLLGQRHRRLAAQEIVVRSAEAAVENDEEELHEIHRMVALEEALALEREEALRLAELRTEARCEEAIEAEGQEEALRRDLQRRELLARKRLSRAEETRRELAGEAAPRALAAREACDAEAAAVEEVECLTADTEEELTQFREELARLREEVARRRVEVRARQDDLEPIQSDLQAKEADLSERQALLERRKASVAAREAALEGDKAKVSVDLERHAALQQQAAAVERRLAALWDDIHQRQQVVDDVDGSLRGREERLAAAQLSLACVRDDVAWGRDAAEAPDARELALEISAAELTERAWRERSAALAQRDAELTARAKLLEATLLGHPGQDAQVAGCK